MYVEVEHLFESIMGTVKPIADFDYDLNDDISAMIKHLPKYFRRRCQNIICTTVLRRIIYCKSSM